MRTFRFDACGGGAAEASRFAAPARMAATVGSAFPTEPFAFAVHSVFPRAVNLRPLLEGADDRAAAVDGYLLTLVADPAQAHPRAVVIPGARFADWGIVPGSGGSFDGERLRLSGFVVRVPSARRDPTEESPTAATAAVPGFVLADFGVLRRAAYAEAAILVDDARRARGLRPALAELVVAAAAEQTAAADASAREPAVDESSAGGVDRAAGRLVRSALALERAADRGDAAGAAEAARLLIGLGAGLTPAGDDFLCGWLAARRAVGAPTLMGDLPLERTTEVSAAFLREAARGRFAAALVDFAAAVSARGCRAVADAAVALQADTAASSARSAVRRAAAVLFSLGHGSGTDAALGFLFAYRGEIGG